MPSPDPQERKTRSMRIGLRPQSPQDAPADGPENSDPTPQEPAPAPLRILETEAKSRGTKPKSNGPPPEITAQKLEDIMIHGMNRIIVLSAVMTINFYEHGTHLFTSREHAAELVELLREMGDIGAFLATHIIRMHVETITPADPEPTTNN